MTVTENIMTQNGQQIDTLHVFYTNLVEQAPGFAKNNFSSLILDL